MSDQHKVRGVIGIFSDEDGHVIAHAADFALSGYGGFTLQRAQEIRVEERLATAICEAYASPRLVRAVPPHARHDIMRVLQRDHKCTVTMISIGHPDA